MQEIEIGPEVRRKRTACCDKPWIQAATGDRPVEQRHCGHEIQRQRDTVIEPQCWLPDNKFAHGQSYVQPQPILP